MTEILPVPRNLYITVLRPPSIFAPAFVYAVFEEKQTKETSVIKFLQLHHLKAEPLSAFVYVPKAIKKRKIHYGFSSFNFDFI